MQFKVSKAVTTTSSLEQSDGYTVGGSVSVDYSLPFIGGGSVSVNYA